MENRSWYRKNLYLQAVKHQVPSLFANAASQPLFDRQLYHVVQHAIGSRPLRLQLEQRDGRLTGVWTEADTLSVGLEALLTPRALVFKGMQYRRTDHYSPYQPMEYRFDDAQLQWAQQEGKVYLCGNVRMHGTGRNEPEKPLYIALERTVAGSSTGHITLTDAAGNPYTVKNGLAAYPNPFTDIVSVDFALAEACEVQVQLLTLEGNLVYSNRAGLLQAGQYTLPLRPGNVAPGNYVLRLQYGKQWKSTPITKL